jgi:hypothetical protein
MPLLARKKILLAKEETTAGTDAAPTGAANAFVTRNLSVTPLEGDTVGRNLDQAVLGNELQIQVGQYVTVEFEVEVAGGGAAGTAPKYGTLFKSCGFVETINAGVSVVYAPTSTVANFKTQTLHFYHDGQRHTVVGARGTFTIDMTPGTIPAYKFMFMGLYVTPTSVADPALTLTGWQVPLAVNKTNTPTFSFHSTSGPMYGFTFDLANDLQYQNVVGSESIQLVDRAPVGTIAIEAPALGSKNWFTTALASTTSSLQLVHGTAAGNIVQFDAPAVEVFSPRYGESAGISTIEMNLAFVPSSGNDEFTITVK